MKKLLFGSALLLAIGCGKQPVVEMDNLVVSNDGSVDKTMNSTDEPFVVLDAQTLQTQIALGRVLDATSAEGRVALGALSRGLTAATAASSAAPPARGTLILGFPVGLLGENHVFGGVITKVSDAKSETLGQLKLSDLPPIPVSPLVAEVSAGKFVFALVGCVEKCAEGSAQEVIATLPVLGIDTQRNLVLVDVAALGDELNLVQMFDPQGQFTKLQTKSNATVAFDYSYSTLVFDVETAMTPLVPAAVPDTLFTVRWYLRLASTFDPAFVPRPAVPGVGYFMTERAATPKIQRFALPESFGGTEVPSAHYYVKNVPTEFQPAFKKAFDEWNGHFVSLLGRRLLSYEFVAANDPRAAYLVPGDVRYNIVEWDLVNAAPYGGLGPSMANQHTGEMLSANVLIQGPKIVELYSKWFTASTQAIALRAADNPFAADALMRATVEEIQARQRASQSAMDLRLNLGRAQFRIPSRMPGYRDPLFQRDDFEEIPAGMNYDTYMAGYFHEMVGHELGHNLGLRHNFRGNLGGTVAGVPGGVSNSIMEYLGRGYRHLNRIGIYDIAAIAYGYAGILPTRTDLFCTDEDVGDSDNPQGSAECSRDDATSDPFAYFQERLDKSVRLLTARGTDAAPVWTVADMDRELTAALTGLGLYVSSAKATAGRWTQFANGTRPADPAAAETFAVMAIESQVCSRDLVATVRLKRGRAARQATQANIDALRVKTAEILKGLKVDPQRVACLP